MKYVIKRDGRKVKFNENKITNAISKAMEAIGKLDKEKAKKYTELVTEELTNRYNEDEKPNVEEIQDIIESILIQENEEELAKEYITYRYKMEIMNIGIQKTLTKMLELLLC